MDRKEIFLEDFISEIIEDENKLNKQTGKFILITPRSRSSIDSFKFTKIDEFIQAGEEAAKKALPKILKVIN